MAKVDLDRIKRLYGPWKQLPVRFIDYPDINEMMDNFMPMLEELEAARKVCEALKKAREEEYCNVPCYVDEALEKYKKVGGDK